MSRSRPFATCDRIPATSANSVIAGTMRRPFPSRPIAAGGPPPDANTRSNSGSLSWAAARKSATTLSTPRRIATSRMSSAAQASICSSDCSPSLARYSVGSADSPPVATAPPSTIWIDREYGRGARGPGGGSGPRSIAVPVIEQLGQPGADRPGPRELRMIGDEAMQLRPGRSGERGDRLPGWATLRNDRQTDADPDPTPEPEPARPVDRHRNDRHTGAQGEISRTLVEWQELRFADMDSSLPGNRENP